jgi:MATE family multidrug resistance protein
VTLAFVFGFGGAGIWIGLVAGLSVVAVLLISRWMGREKLIAAWMPSPRS